jgi:hypothetical protein
MSLLWVTSFLHWPCIHTYLLVAFPIDAAEDGSLGTVIWRAAGEENVCAVVYGRTKQTIMTAKITASFNLVLQQGLVSNPLNIPSYVFMYRNVPDTSLSQIGSCGLLVRMALLKPIHICVFSICPCRTTSDRLGACYSRPRPILCGSAWE